MAQSSEAAEYTDGITVIPHKECLRYDTKQSVDEVSGMLALWGKQSTPSLPSLEGPLCSGVVAPGRVVSMGQTELFDT